MSLTWSYSAQRTLRTCQRQFAFAQIMASAMAKEADRHEAFVLKQVQSLSAWRGSVLHRVLATSLLGDLQAGRRPDAGALTAVAHDLMQRQWEFSGARRYREPGVGKSSAGDEYCALRVHEYGEEIPGGQPAGVLVDLTRCMENLVAHAEFLDYLYAGDRHQTETTLRFQIDGKPAVANPDLLFFTEDGRPAIVDWKAADSLTSYYAPQLFVYALALERCGKWPGVAGASVELYEVNLLRGDVRRHPNSPQRIEEAEDRVYEGFLEQERIFGSGSARELDLTELDVAAKPTTCAYCGFASLCREMLAHPEGAAVQGRLL